MIIAVLLLESNSDGARADLCQSRATQGMLLVTAADRREG